MSTDIGIHASLKLDTQPSIGVPMLAVSSSLNPPSMDELLHAIQQRLAIVLDHLAQTRREQEEKFEAIRSRLDQLEFNRTRFNLSVLDNVDQARFQSASIESLLEVQQQYFLATQKQLAELRESLIGELIAVEERLSRRWYTSLWSWLKYHLRYIGGNS